MSFIGGYISDVNLNSLSIVGDFPVDHALGGYGQATGLNAYALSLTPAILQYRPGMLLSVRFGQANTGLVSLNVNNLGVKPVKKIVGSSLADLEGGELALGKIHLLAYDGTGFQVANSTDGGTGSVPAATENTPGIVQLASAVVAGNPNKAVSPDKLIQYVADKITGLWNNKGLMDCSANPPYPLGVLGDAYTVSVPGKIGGATGVDVDVRDVIYCMATVPGGTTPDSSHWNVLQANVAQATETIAGFARVATLADLQAGADDSRYVTSLKLKTLLDATVKPARSQISFFSDSVADSEITADAATSPNPGTITVNGIPATAIVRQATLIWECSVRNSAPTNNNFVDGYMAISNGGPFVNHLALANKLKLDAGQITAFRLVERDVTDVVTTNGTYTAVCAGLKSQVSSIFMSGYWILNIDYQMPSFL